MTAKKTRMLGALMLLAAAACGGEGLGSDAYDHTELQPQCAMRVPVGIAGEASEPDLIATGDVPLPSFLPDEEGTFHPASGYIEGGTFTVAEQRTAWDVSSEDVAPPSWDERLRVVGWNVERGLQLDKVIRLMKRVNADVWVLSETDLYGGSSGGVVVAREIARALGYSYVTATEFAELRDDRGGSSGDAIVSRFPIRTAEKLDVPILEEEGGYDWVDSKDEPRCGQRSALRAVVDVPTPNGVEQIPFVTLHLENKASKKVRRMQLEAIIDGLTVPGEPTIMAGDLNSFGFREGTSIRNYLEDGVEEHGTANAFFDCSRGDNTHTLTYKKVIKVRIDWMLLQRGESNALDCPIGSYLVLDNDKASDHRPVLTEFLLQ